MSFLNSEVGFERGGTKLALANCVPQVINRNRFGTSRLLTLHLTHLTDTEATTLKTLIGENARVQETAITGAGVVIEYGGATPDGSGAVTVKIDNNAATTISCAFLPGYEFTEIIGPFTENSPTRLKLWSATIPLLRL